jgi:hypothetical protein
MTEPASTEEALAARLEALRRKQAVTAGGARPGRRRHAAPRSRVAAAALGVGVTIGLVAAMHTAGFPTAAAASTSTAPIADGPVVIVVHHGAKGAAPGPVALRANPVVRSVTPRPSAAAPAARTHGSR